MLTRMQEPLPCSGREIEDRRPALPSSRDGDQRWRMERRRDGSFSSFFFSWHATGVFLFFPFFLFTHKGQRRKISFLYFKKKVCVLQRVNAI